MSCGHYLNALGNVKVSSTSKRRTGIKYFHRCWFIIFFLDYCLISVLSDLIVSALQKMYGIQAITLSTSNTVSEDVKHKTGNNKTKSLKKTLCFQSTAILSAATFFCFTEGHFSRVHLWWCSGFRATELWVEWCFHKHYRPTCFKKSGHNGPKINWKQTNKAAWCDPRPLPKAKMVLINLPPLLVTLPFPLKWLFGWWRDSFALFVCTSLPTAAWCPVLGGSWTNELLAQLALGRQTQNSAGICAYTQTHRRTNHTKNTSSQTVCQILHFNLIKPSSSGSMPFVLFSLSAFSPQEASMCTLPKGI